MSKAEIVVKDRKEKHMITLNNCQQGNENDYKGLSTDTKPTNCAVNSLFLELDTGDFYYFDGETWSKIGGE